MVRLRVDPLSEAAREASVFEYGSGFSTQWWERHAASVDAVQHDAGWAKQVEQRLGNRATLRHIELDYGGEYCRAILAAEKRYEVVVVDGRDRVNCVKFALQRLRRRRDYLRQQPATEIPTWH